MKHLLTALLMLVAFTSFATNHALLVGIGRYQPGTGWTAINGDADVDLLAAALKAKGFTDIIPLKNSQATKAAIIKELQALAKRCNSGDKVYFHFSGHGQPVKDINHDEGIKQFDEAIVPYNAFNSVTKRVNGKYYNGEAHLTDDELNPLFRDIKQKIGPQGQLFIAIDACYSDDMERTSVKDDDDLPPTRGTYDTLNIKPTSVWHNIPKPLPYPPGAKMYVASACKYNERNFEYRAPDGKTYGSLTYFIYILIARTTDFEQWATSICNKNNGSGKIFFHYQHPQIKYYK